MLVFFFYIFQFRVVFLAVSHQWDHDCSADDHGPNGDRGKAEARAGYRIHQEIQGDAYDHCRKNCNDSLDGDDVCPLLCVVRQGHHQGIHGHLIEGAGEVIKQIAYHKPGNLRADRQR